MAKAESKLIIEFSEEDRELLRQLIRARPTIITQPVPTPTPPYRPQDQWWQNPVISCASTLQVQSGVDQIVLNSSRHVNGELRGNG